MLLALVVEIFLLYNLVLELQSPREFLLRIMALLTYQPISLTLYKIFSRRRISFEEQTFVHFEKGTHSFTHSLHYFAYQGLLMCDLDFRLLKFVEKVVDKSLELL